MNIANKFIDDNGKNSCKCENCKSEEKEKELIKDKNPITLFSTSQASTNINTLKCKERKVLFMEYVSNIHLKHAMRTNNDQLSATQLIMCLAAIQQGIDYNGLCHYDLHIDNILLKECDPNCYYAYRFKDGNTILTPTLGYYPVFIDFGTSYIHSYVQPDNKYNCKTSVINSQNGLQSTVFDKFIDAHQLIISSMFELEKISDRFHYLSTEFMKHFHQIKIYRETGWKSLPFDIFNLLLNKIEEYDPSIEDEYPIMQTQQSDLIELLSLSIQLPFKPASDDDVKGMCKKYNLKYKSNSDSTDQCVGYLIKNICIHITKIQRSLNLIKDDKEECNLNDDEIYYIIREIIETKNPEELETIRTKYKMGKKCELKKCWNYIQDLSIFLSSLYYQYFRTHEEIINDMYKSLPYKEVYDIAYYLQKHVPVRPIEYGTVDVYCFDSITKTQTVKKLDTSDYKPGSEWIKTKCKSLF